MIDGFDNHNPTWIVRREKVARRKEKKTIYD
jgi:hypothetical protein